MGQAGDTTTVLLLDNAVILVCVRAFVEVVIRNRFNSYGHH